MSRAGRIRIRIHIRIASCLVLLAPGACDRGSDERADARADEAGAVVATTAEGTLPAWLAPTDGTDPARWLAGREAGKALPADDPRVRAMATALAGARDGFIEDPRMIANRTVQLGQMLAEAGTGEGYGAILDGLGGIAAERGRRKSLYGEMCQHYYNARMQGADHAAALARLAAPHPAREGDAVSAARASADRPAGRDGPRGLDAVLIVDDHPVVRRGFRHLAEDAGVRAVHEAADVVSGYRTFHRHRPGLVVTDLGFRDQGLSGLSLIRRVRALEPATRILAFSMHDDPVIVARAIEGGAHGFVLKDTAVTRFHEALATVSAGRSYLPHEVATKIAMLNAGLLESPLARLTAREVQVLSLLGAGKSNEAIADSLSMSQRSVSAVVSGMKQKLGAGSLADLLRIALSRDGRPV